MPRFQVGDGVRVPEDTQYSPGALLRGRTGTVTAIIDESQYMVRFEGAVGGMPVRESALEAASAQPAPGPVKAKDESWGWVTMVIGLGFLAFGVLDVADTFNTFADRTSRTEGAVVGEKFQAVEEGTIRLPVVSFVTEAGRSIVFTSNSGWGSDRIGASVPVRYDPTDPTDARVDSPPHLWGGLIFPLVGGLMIFFNLRGRRRRRATPGPGD